MAGFVNVIDMKELENITFVIPVRIDSEERKTNLDTVLDYLCIYNEVKIIVLEADSERRYNPEIKHSGFSYFFIEDHDPVFHRTRYLNLLLRSAKTPVAGVWDSDVIVSYEQIFESVRRCMNEDTLSYPYDGRFYYVSNEISRSYRDTRNFDIIDQKEYQHFIYHGLHSVGGAFVVNLERYISAGGENENFYGWGPEDTERRERINSLGFKVSRVEGCLYHLHHPRYINSRYSNKELELVNRREYMKICRMNRSELEEYISTWSWMKSFNTPINLSELTHSPIKLKGENHLKHAILILAHKNIDHILKFIRLFDNDFSIYIHIDKKYKLSLSEKAALKSEKKIKFISQKYAVNWSGINIIKAELHLMESAIKDEDIDYIHLVFSI